ncbi:TetR/AcrR family transcriptional regulator [Mycobacterium sp. M23085]|uniref:TetR/AcrR family transcriptional regulator n=1 Tax=Mycobacterium sp. M23085 TaxID=3378087 RepID=UPI003877EDFD
MPKIDWLVGADRNSAAADKIYAAAADLIAEVGYDAFTIEALAARIHCSPATIYRRAGGKAAIRDAVVAIQATRILHSVRDAIDGLSGSDRVVKATLSALQRIQSDPVVESMSSFQIAPDVDWVTTSPVIASFAAEMLGEDNQDPLAAQWLIRVFLALLCWPVRDSAAQHALVERFLGASFNGD